MFTGESATLGIVCHSLYRANSLYLEHHKACKEPSFRIFHRNCIISKVSQDENNFKLHKSNNINGFCKFFSWFMQRCNQLFHQSALEVTVQTIWTIQEVSKAFISHLQFKQSNIDDKLLVLESDDIIKLLIQ